MSNPDNSGYGQTNQTGQVRFRILIELSLYFLPYNNTLVKIVLFLS